MKLLKQISLISTKEAAEDTTDDLITDEEESYLDDDLDFGDLGPSSTSFPDFPYTTSCKCD